MVFDVLLGRHGTGGVSHHVSRADLVGKIVVHGTIGFAHGHPPAAEEHVLGGHAAVGIGLHHRRRTRPEQIELARGLGHTLALAVVIVRYPARRVGTIL